MKIFFEKHDLVIKSESYEENIALETWSEIFFKRVDLNTKFEYGYFLLLVLFKGKDE